MENYKEADFILTNVSKEWLGNIDADLLYKGKKMLSLQVSKLFEYYYVRIEKLFIKSTDFYLKFKIEQFMMKLGKELEKKIQLKSMLGGEIKKVYVDTRATL